MWRKLFVACGHGASEDAHCAATMRKTMNAIAELAIPEAALSDYCRRNEIAYLALFGSAGRGELV